MIELAEFYTAILFYLPVFLQQYSAIFGILPRYYRNMPYITIYYSIRLLSLIQSRDFILLDYGNRSCFNLILYRWQALYQQALGRIQARSLKFRPKKPYKRQDIAQIPPYKPIPSIINILKIDYNLFVPYKRQILRVYILLS